MKQERSRALLHVGFSLDLFFLPEYGGHMFLQDVG
jgi:hypothetical protein